MAENDNQEQIEFKSQLEIQLELSGVPDVSAAFQEIINYEKRALKDISALKVKYGGFDGAIRSLIKSYKQRATVSSRTDKAELRRQKKLMDGYSSLTREVKGYGLTVGSLIKQTILPGSFGSAIKTTLRYNESLLATSASVNRLGLGLGFLEASFGRISKEVSLTRRETIQLFDKYQESMRFVSLQQFEKMLKRIKSITGANAQAIGKMQGAISSVSQEYPGLSMGMASLKTANDGLVDSEKAVIQERIRNLYFIGKIGDAQYKQLTAYISGNQQMIGADKRRQRQIQAQIDAAQQFSRQWESASLAIGKQILPYLDLAADALSKIQDMTKNWEVTLLKIGGIYAGLKLGMTYSLPAIGAAARGIGRGGISLAGMAGRNIAGSGIGRTGAATIGIGKNLLSGISRIFGGKGFAGKTGGIIGGLASGAGMVMGGSGSRVFVTNWPMSLGPSSLLSPIGGAGGKGGGFMGGLSGGKGAKSFLGKSWKSGLGKSVGIGLVTGLSSLGAKYGAAKLEESGHTRTAGVAQIGGSLLGAATYAATGAAIGSMVPIVGTAIGGIAGGIYGAFKEWKGLASGFKKLFKKSDAEEKRIEEANAESKKLGPLPDMKSRLLEFESDRKDEKLHQDEIMKAQKADMKSLEKQGIGSLFGEISIDVRSAEKVLEKERAKVDKLIAEKFKEIGIAEIDVSLKDDALNKNITDIIESQKERIAEVKRVMDESASYYRTREGGKERKIEDQASLAAEEKRLENLFEIIEKEEDRGTALKDANKHLEVQNSRLHQIITPISKQKDIAEALSGLYQSQVGNIDAIIERMSITGNIDMGKAFEAIDKGLVTLNAEITAQEKLLNILGMKNNEEAKAEADKASKKKDISQATKAMFKELAMVGVEGIDQIAILAKQEDAQKRINSLVKDRTELLGKIGNAYGHTLKLVQAQATGVGLLVQLADNYAIGVGASAKLRMQEYDMQGQIISVLKEKFKSQQTAYIMAIGEGKTDEENLVLKTNMQETHNEMVQAQIKQASIVRSMRDSWVSAISAMNVGMDGFTEIIMNAEQNTAQIQMLDGAVRSSVSGAYALRDAFGRVIEDVGFQASEAMNVFGDIYGRGGRQLWEPSYISETEKRMGITRETGGIREIMEGAARGDIRAMVGGQISATKYAAGGNFEVHAATGHKYTLSALVGQESYRKSAALPLAAPLPQSVNSINFILDNLVIHIDKINGTDELLIKIKDKFDAKMESIANEFVGGFTDPTQH